MKKNYLSLFFLILFSLTSLACEALTGSGTTSTSTDSEAVVAAAVSTIDAQLQFNSAGNSDFPIAQVGTSIQSTLVNLYKQVNPAVVHIISTFGSGSGFVFDTDGHLITNNHVVEGSDSFEVVFGNGQRRWATVVGVDVDSDLAVIKVNSLPEGVHPLTLGDSSQVEVGQVVVAIGNPFGEENSMSMGIISGLGRSLNSQRQGYSLPEVIQTDAPINPGNSGGPLFDLNGRVIGVNAAIRSNTGVNSGVGFVIPVNAVHRIVPALIAEGAYTYPYLGVSVFPEPIDLTRQEQLDLPQTTGAYIVSVEPNSPAAHAGIIGQRGAGGDLITAIDGKAVLEFNDLLSYLVFETEVGQTVEVTLLRDNTEMTIPVTLGERP